VETYLIKITDPQGECSGWEEVVVAANPQQAVYTLLNDPPVFVAGGPHMPDSGDEWWLAVHALRGKPPRLTSAGAYMGSWTVSNDRGTAVITPKM